DPGVSCARASGARLPAGSRSAAGRASGRLSRQPGPYRPCRRILPAPPRFAVVWTQRGIRPALHLSWLEVRRRRQLPRSDERARAILPQDPPDGLSDDRDRRGDLDLYGSAREDAGTPGFRVDAGAREPSPRLESVG